MKEVGEGGNTVLLGLMEGAGGREPHGDPGSWRGALPCAQEA